MGDVSVMAAANAKHNAAAGPTLPSNAMMQPVGAVQPLQPVPQPMMMMPAPAQAAPVNPFDFGAVASSMPAAPAPAGLPPQAPPTPPGQQAEQLQQWQHQQSMSPPLSPVAPNGFAPQGFAAPHGFAPHPQGSDPFGYAFTPMTSPVTSPITSPNGSPGAGNSFGVHGGQQQPACAPANGLPPSIPNFGVQQQQNGQAVVPSAVAPSADPFGVWGSQPAPATNADPFGSSALVTSAPPAGGAVDDPFGIFGTPTPAPAAPAQAPAPPAQQVVSAPTTEEEDPWAAAGFNQMVSPAQASAQPTEAKPDPRLEHVSSADEKQEEKPIILDSNRLPSEGEYYEARINARSLGAMFYTARNLEETLYHKMPNNIIEALATRPVVAYVAENSAAFNSGVHLGHIILSVNGHTTTDPEFCANMIRNAPRPMNLRCYVPPSMELTINEGRHMVKYDTKDLEAPKSSVEWKRKYVVVGGIVTKPWMMNMFYRKKDYDIAVKEAHAGHKVSVKVKQFDLRGARIILKGRDGKPNWVDYPSERKPWYYITILPNKGYPIKISSDSLEELEPVYSAVRRFVRKDMEANYQYRMDAGLGGGGGRRGSGAGKSAIVRTAGFEQFNEGAKDSYWH